MLTLSISAAALLMLSIASVTTTAEQQQQPSSSQLLQHRHSLFSTLPVEPIDDNFQVTRHQVKVVDLAGFREWEVKGSHQALIRAADPQRPAGTENNTFNGTGRVHLQWFDSNAPLLRPPFTPTFLPGFHLAVTSNDFVATWKEHCPVLAELVGGIDCQDQEDIDHSHTDQTLGRTIRFTDLIPIYNHRYVHRIVEPNGFLSSSSLLSSLISNQQSGSTTGPALIDMVLHNSKITLKVVWPVVGRNTIQITFDEKTDKVAEVGWFYREITEQEHTVYDHYLGATVKMDAQGETVNEALIQTRSSVFPPHKRDSASGKIHKLGHGFTSTMTPAQTFHPHSVTTIRSNPYIAQTTNGCDLHVLQVLPVGVFVDPFQLESLESEIGKTTVFGETDLEKPVGVVTGWGSMVMVKVQPEDSIKTSRWIPGNATEKGDTSQDKESSYISTVDIPMHMRYQPPVPVNDPATHIKVDVPWPIVAWTCPSVMSGEEASIAAAKKLFHIPVLPLSLLFTKEGKETVDFRFVLPDPIPERYPHTHVSVPVGQLKDLKLVRTLTFAMAGMGTLAVAMALVKTVSSRNNRSKGKQD
ncbi:protease B nonderepressible form [Mortierella polycephala]|uniref:Protein PBN1 n=1 Tax=Mortierella polycephala TaxID=41804 RepID=A0A9P6Q0W0_9FUNG|nr:protease B nonderepressible form [Mortierella polycephala]